MSKGNNSNLKTKDYEKVSSFSSVNSYKCINV